MYSDHPRCRWVCFFIRFREMLQCITCSAMDALQWMGAVRMRVQTADKNITIIYITPVHQFTSWEDKMRVVRNKSIKPLCFWLKCESIIHNNSSSSEKVYLLLSLTSKSSHTFVSSCFGLFWLVNTAWSVQISLLIHRLLFHWRKQYFVYRTLILATVGFVSAFVFSRC